MARMYFVGVTTGASQARALFPHWVRAAGRAGAELTGVDIPLGSPPGAVRNTVLRIREDDDAAGGLVTAHKVAVFQSARDLFDEFDEEAALLGEVSCIVKRGSRLIQARSRPAPLVPFLAGWLSRHSLAKRDQLW